MLVFTVLAEGLENGCEFLSEALGQGVCDIGLIARAEAGIFPKDQPPLRGFFVK